MRQMLIFSEDTLIYNGKDFEAGNPLPRLYESLAHRIGGVVLSGPVKVTSTPSGHEGWIERKISYSPRPYYGGSVLGFLKNLPRILLPTVRNINANVRRADLVMIRLPSPIGFLVYRQAQRLGKPYFLYIAGDIREVAAQGEKYRGPTRAVVTLAANIFHWLAERMAKGTLVFTTGSELYSRFNSLSGRCANLIPSVVSQQDIVHRTDACEKEPIRLLYVGRLVPVKGLRYLLEAMEILNERGLGAELEIVGEGYHRSVLEALVRNLALGSKVRFLGRVPFGLALFEIYRRADLFVLPSLSEGIPKTLLEAMASGVPIVATHVGGVPDVIKHEETGLLVEPRSSQVLADAIERLSHDVGLRKSIVENSYAFVREHTVERQAEGMWQEICDFFGLEGA